MKHVLSFILLSLLSHVEVFCKNNVVVVVLDGLKNDYLKNSSSSSGVSLPNLQSIINDGIYVENITPEFPSSRLPFVTSLLTGRHAQEHGILGTEVYDKKLEKILKMEEDNDLFWEKARKMENIWVSMKYILLSDQTFIPFKIGTSLQYNAKLMDEIITFHTRCMKYNHIKYNIHSMICKIPKIS